MRPAVFDGLRDYLADPAQSRCRPLDIDMEGNYEPWRTNLTRTRFIRDLYRTKVELNYRWLDKTGKLKAKRQESVSDLNYLQRLETQRFRGNDPLKYEKTLLARWFKERFLASPQ